MTQLVPPRTLEEVTGIRSAVTRMQAIAAAHQAVASSEGFIGSLNRMEVGAPDQQKVKEAMAKSAIAGQKWAHAATLIAQHNLPVQEAYQANPNAANKAANTNE